MLLTAANDNIPPATGLLVAYYIAIRAAYSTMLASLAYWAHGLPG